jgi:hypothetical protein
MDKQQLIEILRNNRGNFKDIYNFLVNTTRKGGGFVGAVGNAADFLGNIPKNIKNINKKFKDKKEREAQLEQDRANKIVNYYRKRKEAEENKKRELNKMLDRTEKGFPLNKKLDDINENAYENMNNVLEGLEDYNKSKKFNVDDAITQSKVYQKLEKQKQLAKEKADKKGLRELNKQLAKTKTPFIPFNKKGQTYKDLKQLGEKSNSYLNLFTPPTTKVPKYHHSQKVAKTPLSQKLNNAIEQNKKPSTPKKPTTLHGQMKQALNKMGFAPAPQPKPKQTQAQKTLSTGGKQGQNNLKTMKNKVQTPAKPSKPKTVGGTKNKPMGKM